MSHILEGLDQSPPYAKSVEPEAYSNDPEGSQNGRPHFEQFPMHIVTIPVHPDVPELVRNRTAEAPTILPNVTRKGQDDLGISLPPRIQSPDRLGQRRTTAWHSDAAKCQVQIPQGLLSKSRKDDGIDRGDA